MLKGGTGYHVIVNCSQLPWDLITLSASYSQVPRLDEYLRANLAIFKDIFGGDFFSHVILVFTRWGYDPRSIRDRERDGQFKVSLHQVYSFLIPSSFTLSITPHSKSWHFITFSQQLNNFIFRKFWTICDLETVFQMSNLSCIFW